MRATQEEAMFRPRWYISLIVLVLAGLPACVSQPEYADPLTELRAQGSPLKTIRLGVVYTGNTQKSFEYIEKNKKLAVVAYPLAASDIGSEMVSEKLKEVLSVRFKEVTLFDSIEKAQNGNVDLLMTFDFVCTLGQRTGHKTRVDMTGTFMDRNLGILDSIKGKGKATAWVWTYRFREVLKNSFGQFAKDLDQSQKLKGFVERGAPLPRPAQISASVDQVKPTAYYRKSWAVVIGINRYNIWPPLQYAVKDALATETKLREMGFDEIITLLDKEATRARILTLLGTDLPKKVAFEDRVVIFFAGHGQTESLGDGKEQGYIIPVDGDITNYFTTAISMPQLRELSQRISAKHLLYVMDSCYSGQGFTRAFGIDPAIQGYLHKITSMRSVQMITAGGKGEQAAELQGHGVFTQYFLRGLDGEADRDNDGVVTTSELGAFLMPQVSRASDNLQTPQYGRLDGEGEVIFVLPSKKNA